jgi:lysophospholipase L1-like esterase
MQQLARISCSIVLCTIVAGCASTPTREVEPPGQLTVLIVGDSISMERSGFFKGLVERIGDRYNIAHNPGNAGNSAHVAANIQKWVETACPDIIHINCGLHDIKYDRDKKALAIPPGQYEQNLRHIAGYLEGLQDTTVIFALTTPVIDAWHRANKPFDRREADVQHYNATARRVMSEYDIKVSDLHRPIVEAGPESCLVPDGVHMNGKGNRILADAVAKTIERAANAK